MRKEVKMSGKQFTKKWFLREVADQAGFTLGDVQIIWETIEKLLIKIIIDRDELYLPPFFHMMVRGRKGRNVVNIKTGEHWQSQDSLGVKFKAGTALRKYLRNDEGSVDADDVDESLQPRLF
jgi:nucleoid DNA-binding protein